MSIGGDVEQAIARGLAFLAHSQQEDGSFGVMISTDPAMVTGCTPDPSVFPTALIAQSLSQVAGAGKCMDRALDFLAREGDKHGLWRHWTRTHPLYRLLPPDLDDTSCVSQALASSGRAPPLNRPVLLANRNGRGLFYTWFTLRPRLVISPALWRSTLPQLWHVPALVLFFLRTSAKPADIDAVVNANALYYLGLTLETQPVVEYLLAILKGKQEASCDKWYDNPFAVWYFFSRALSRHTPEAGAIIIPRLRAAQPANLLDMALATLTLLAWGVMPEEATMTALLAGQMPSGAWPTAALYHGGRQRLADGTFKPPHPATPRWGSEELTTAFCLQALTRWREAM